LGLYSKLAVHSEHSFIFGATAGLLWPAFSKSKDFYAVCLLLTSSLGGCQQRPCERRERPIAKLEEKGGKGLGKEEDMRKEPKEGQSMIKSPVSNVPESFHTGTYTYIDS